MASKRITIQLRGDPSDDDHLRLADFIAQLDTIRVALVSLEEHLTQTNRSVYYRVVDLKHSSPATVVLEPVSDSKSRDVSALVAHRFVDGLKRIKQGEIPSDFSYEVLESFKKIAGPLKRKVSEVTISTDEERVEVTKSIESDIDRIVGPDEVVLGSICGTLEALNLHAQANIFRIYPVVGPRKVEGHFPNSLRQQAIAGIDHYVQVHGELRSKRNEKFPYAINVRDLEVFPDDESLPTILDLKGIAPQATGDMTSEDFVRKLRHGNW